MGVLFLTSTIVMFYFWVPGCTSVASQSAKDECLAKLEEQLVLARQAGIFPKVDEMFARLHRLCGYDITNT